MTSQPSSVLVVYSSNTIAKLRAVEMTLGWQGEFALLSKLAKVIAVESKERARS